MTRLTMGSRSRSIALTRLLTQTIVQYRLSQAGLDPIPFMAKIL